MKDWFFYPTFAIIAVGGFIALSFGVPTEPVVGIVLISAVAMILGKLFAAMAGDSF